MSHRVATSWRAKAAIEPKGDGRPMGARGAPDQRRPGFNEQYGRQPVVGTGMGGEGQKEQECHSPPVAKRACGLMSGQCMLRLNEHTYVHYTSIIAAHQRALASAHAHATMAAAQTSSAVSRACSRSTADALSARSAADARSRSSLSALSALSRSA